MIPHILTSQYDTSAWTQWDNETNTIPVLGTTVSHTPPQLYSKLYIGSPSPSSPHHQHLQLMDWWEGSIKWCIVVWSKANTCLLSTDKMDRLRADLWFTTTTTTNTILTWPSYTASFSRTVKKASLLALGIFLHHFFLIKSERKCFLFTFR